MPSRAQKDASTARKTTRTAKTNEESPVTENSATADESTSPETITVAIDRTSEPITVNVALAIKITPAKWSTKELSAMDLLTAKIMAEKSVDEAKARELAQMMIDNGLADMVTTSKGVGVNDVRREIREFVLTQVAAMPAFADATVELNEARRTNHKPKDA